jgi:SAM-dependent methyltransferase
MPRTSQEVHSGLVESLEDPEVRAPFSLEFLRAVEEFDLLVNAACERLLCELGGFPGDGGTTPEEVAAARRVPARAMPALRFLFEKLADAGHLVAREGRFFPGQTRAGDPHALADALALREPRAAVGAEVMRVLVDEGAAFFRGEKTGEEILFSPSRLPLWFRYFSNENLLYSVNNALGAVALARALPPKGAAVLEVGGGCGSAAETALKQLGGWVARYRFTELVPTFARRGERAARAAAFPGTLVEASRLDMTAPWASQGIEPGTYDAAYSVNCFHVAPDLGFVLAEARAALKPGGAVVISEGIRPTRSARPIYVELIFDFLESFTSVKTDPLLRPTHGFLTPAAWRASLTAAGFEGVTILPDVDTLAERYPDFFVGTVTARR